MNPTAISLIVDDGAPVKLMHWTHPDECHAALVGTVADPRLHKAVRWLKTHQRESGG